MTRPVRLEPYELDWSESARVFWGASLSLRRWRQLQAEGHALRLDESGETVTERRLTTLGGRLYKNPRPGDPDYELEAARQVGTSQGLDHDAFLVHLETGYTFRRGRARLTALCDHASGDQDPGDRRFERFEARLRWRPRRGLLVEAAWSHFFKGSYLKRVPGSPSTPDSDYFTVGFEVGGRLLAR